MNKKIVAIISNELENDIPLFAFPCEESHTEGLREFIFSNDIQIPEEKLLSTQEMSFSIAEQGYLVMLYDSENGNNNLIGFIPNIISPKQLKWFQKREEDLSNYNIAFFDYRKDLTWDLVDNTTTIMPIISELMKRLNKKLTSISSKEKVR